MRLGILISGRGSNFEAIANSIARKKLEAEIAIVISNRANAPGIEIARERGIPIRIIPSAGMDRETYDKLLIDELQTHEVDLVCLAGFMRLLSADFIRAFPNRVLNIHPSLLPAFAGLDAQRQALEYGVRITGCTVHFVDEYLDSGPIFSVCGSRAGYRYGRNPFRPYPASGACHLSEAVGLIVDGRVTIEGRRVTIREED